MTNSSVLEDRAHSLAWTSWAASGTLDTGAVATVVGMSEKWVRSALMRLGWRLAPLAPPYVPKQPTTGWMLSELERHGEVARGTSATDAQLAARLRARGYNVSAA